MQTFMPYPDYEESLRCLDMKRLGKQRVEAYQLITILLPNLFPNKIQTKAWRNHPACLMWKKYEYSLVDYYNINLKIWNEKGGRNIKLDYINHSVISELPFWIGDEAFHSSHRSNLLRKKPDFYNKYGWNEPSDLPYVWPSLKIL